jgi:hypothetical protein
VSLSVPPRGYSARFQCCEGSTREDSFILYVDDEYPEGLPTFYHRTRECVRREALLAKG